MSAEDSKGPFPVRFEFNEFKSRIDRRKHGIDFVEAQALWLDDKHWSAIITYRGDVIRLISVRRSRPREVAIYESQ